MKKYKISDLFKTSWAELTEAEMILLIDFSTALQSVDPESKEYGLIVINILRTLRKNKSAVAKIELEQAVDCFNDIVFFRRTTKGSFRMPWYFFPVGDFKLHGQEFCRPDMSGELPMYNRSFDQLVYADSAFSAFCLLNNQYSQTQDKQTGIDMDQAVNALIAILYTRCRDFNPAEMDLKAKLVPIKLSMPQRTLILHTYANIRELIMDRLPNLFPKVATEEDEDTDPVIQVTGPMWMNLRYDLAETDAFKGFDTARNALIYDALDYLEKKAREANEHKKKEPQHA